ncbi:hypothetical protein SCB29_37655, partial [Paraburkholderia sp. SIMBA_055]
RFMFNPYRIKSGKVQRAPANFSDVVVSEKISLQPSEQIDPPADYETPVAVMRRLRTFRRHACKKSSGRTRRRYFDGLYLLSSGNLATEP